jgi:hypothetical protein
MTINNAVSAPLRKAVEDAIAKGATRYSIAKGAGIDQASFVRWLDEGRDIRISTADKLAAYFGLVLKRDRKKG